MNVRIAKKRPKNTSKEDWDALWGNNNLVLLTLIDILKEMRGVDTITEEDLLHPNIHDKLVWDTSKRRIIDQIVSIIDLPIDKPSK